MQKFYCQTLSTLESLLMFLSTTSGAFSEVLDVTKEMNFKREKVEL